RLSLGSLWSLWPLWPLRSLRTLGSLLSRRTNRSLRSLRARWPSWSLCSLLPLWSLCSLRPGIALRSRRTRRSNQTIDINNSELIVSVNHHRHYRSTQSYSINTGYKRGIVNGRVTDANRVRFSSHTAVPNFDVIVPCGQVDPCVSA